MFSFISSFFGTSSESSPMISGSSEPTFIPTVSSWKTENEGLFRPRPKLPNVGKFEAMTEKSHEIFDIEPQTFNGIQLNLQNILHPSFVTAHSVAIGKKESIDPHTNKKDDERSLYTYSTFLKTGNWQLNGRWSNNGITRAVAQYESGILCLSASGQFSTEERRNMWEADGAITKDDWCAQIKLQGPAVGFSYTQPILPKYSIGSEVFVSPLNELSRLKWIGKHENKEEGSTSTFSYTTGIGADQFSVDYTKTIKKNLDISAALDVSREEKNWTSVFKLGYQHKNGSTCVRGMMDSTLKAICIWEEPIHETFMASACIKMDFPKDVYDIGLSVTATV